MRLRLCHVYSDMAGLETEKCVLVGLETPSGVRNRAVHFTGQKQELLSAVRESFADLLSRSTDAELILQIRDDSWGVDVFVDLLQQNVPNRAVLKVLLAQKNEVWYNLLE